MQTIAITSYAHVLTYKMRWMFSHSASERQEAAASANDGTCLPECNLFHARMSKGYGK
jgi:hypothetical protein